MSTDQSYEFSARYYDDAYREQGQARADAGFYERLAIEAGGPVLELGCGTGRVLLPMAARGLDCTGIDRSPAMLEQLRRKPQSATVFTLCAGMENFDLGARRFGLIFSAFRAFQHLDTVEQQLACLERVRAHLAPGGVFAFDVFSPKLENMAVDTSPEVVDLDFINEGRAVRRYVAVNRDRARQLITVTMRYVEKPETGPARETLVTFTMRWFWRYELEHLLHRAGFTEVTIYGDFDRSPVGRETPAYVVVAR
ncbi:MAG: class I SAM-dependent DNA methyltransferase [Opitutales bacterium]